MYLCIYMYICIYKYVYGSYTYIFNNSQFNGGHEFQKEQREVYGKHWREEREGEKNVLMLNSKKAENTSNFL